MAVKFEVTDRPVRERAKKPLNEDAVTVFQQLAGLEAGKAITLSEFDSEDQLTDFLRSIRALARNADKSAKTKRDDEAGTLTVWLGEKITRKPKDK